MKKLRTRVLVGVGAGALALTGFVGVTHATEPSTGDISTQAAGYCTKTGTFKKNGYVYVLPVDSSGARGCTMSQGANGKHVEALQRALTYCYSQGLDIDGIWGPKTTAALKNAQRSMGAVADGAFGPETNSKIKWRAILDNPNNPVADCRIF